MRADLTAQLSFHAWLEAEQAAEHGGPARVPGGGHRLRVTGDNRRGGPAVEATRWFHGRGSDSSQCSTTTSVSGPPRTRPSSCATVGRCRSDQEGQHFHRTENELDERELNLEAVLGEVRQVEDRYESVPDESVSRRGVDLKHTKRRGEAVLRLKQRCLRM